MSHSILYLGMDGHKESVTIAVLPADAAAPTRVERLPNDLVKLKRFLDRLAQRVVRSRLATKPAAPATCCSEPCASGGTPVR